jgi:DNA polymerase
MIDAHRVTLSAQDDFDGWRDAARDLAEAGVPPSAIVWRVDGGPDDLFAAEAPQPKGASFAVPRAFIDLSKSVVCHSDPERFALLYTMLWKLRTNRNAFEDRADPLVDRLERLAKEVRRDVHKMHAFVRFREIDDRFVAFFEPDHHIVRHTAGFFVRRFTNMRWSILTPELSIHWDGEALTEGPGATRAEAPGGDPLEALWKTYYASIFNPARLKVGAMLKEMPKKYWRNMPETAAIPALVRAAAGRTEAMIEREPTMPKRREPARAVAAMADQDPKSLDELNAIIRRTEPLVPGATQAVLGEGPVGATIAFVGEQPGDQEDRQGRPFVGPAGQLLSRAMAEAGIDRRASYLTNAVKHFKFEERGKRRIHQKPTAGEVSHYRWWLDRELEFVGPKLVVALGATAVLALTGKAIPITRARGPFRFDRLDNRFQGFITVHPSYLLRLPEEAKAEAYAAFVDDLRRVEALGRELAA